MRTTLVVISSPAGPRRMELREGQVGQFGRSSWADFPFAEDAALADLHFSIECRATGCVLRHLAANHVTLVNDAPAAVVVLKSGDQIRAGQTILKVVIDGEIIVAPTFGAATPEEEVSSGPKKWPGAQWLQLAEYLELPETATALIVDPQTAGEWIDALIAAELYPEAARLLAHQLEKREAVWWSCCCIDLVDAGRLPPLQQQALAAARAWVIDPSEANRRAAESATERASYRGPAGMCAAAAFWAGDNIAPADIPGNVPPDERLTGKAVTTSLVISAYFRETNQSLQRWAKFLEIGRAVAEGKNRWPAVPGG